MNSLPEWVRAEPRPSLRQHHCPSRSDCREASRSARVSREAVEAGRVREHRGGALLRGKAETQPLPSGLLRPRSPEGRGQLERGPTAGPPGPHAQPASPSSKSSLPAPPPTPTLPHPQAALALGPPERPTSHSRRSGSTGLRRCQNHKSRRTLSKPTAASWAPTVQRAPHQGKRRREPTRGHCLQGAGDETNYDPPQPQR